MAIKSSLRDIEYFLEAVKKGRAKGASETNDFSVLDKWKAEQLQSLLTAVSKDTSKLKKNLEDEDFQLFLELGKLDDLQLKKILANKREKSGTLARILFGPLTSILGLGTSIYEIFISAFTAVIIGKIAFLSGGALLGVTAGVYSAYILKKEANKIAQEHSHRNVELAISNKLNLARQNALLSLNNDIKSVLIRLNIVTSFSVAEPSDTSDKQPTCFYSTKASLDKLIEDLENATDQNSAKEAIRRNKKYQNAIKALREIGSSLPQKEDQREIAVLPSTTNIVGITKNKTHFSDLNHNAITAHDLNTSPGPTSLKIHDWLSKKNIKRAVALQVTLLGIGVTAGTMGFAGFLGVLGLSSFIFPVLLPVAVAIGVGFAASFFYGLYRNAQRNHGLTHLKKQITAAETRGTELLAELITMQRVQTQIEIIASAVDKEKALQQSSRNGKVSSSASLLDASNDSLQPPSPKPSLNTVVIKIPKGTNVQIHIGSDNNEQTEANDNNCYVTYLERNGIFSNKQNPEGTALSACHSDAQDSANMPFKLIRT